MDRGLGTIVFLILENLRLDSTFAVILKVVMASGCPKSTAYIYSLLE